MSPAIRTQITAELGVEPMLINSALVSAQNRQRLYWVGRRNPDGTYSQVPVEQPEDRGILLRDILETSTSKKGYALDPTHAEVLNMNPSGHGMNGAVIHCDGKSRTLTTNKGEGPKIITPIRIGTIENDAKNPGHDSQQYRVYSPDAKSVTLCGNGGGLGAKTGLYAVPVAEQDACCVAQRGRYIGENGSVAQHLEARDDGKTNTLTTVQKDNMIAVPVRVGAMPNKDGELGTSQSRRIYSTDGKSVSLQARPNGGGADGAATGLYAVPAAVEYNPLHSCDVVVTDQNIRCTYKDGSGTAQGYTVTFDDVKSPSVIAGHAHKMKVIERVTDKKQMPVYEVRGGRITIKGKTYPIKLADGFYIIRKLTVTECKRLQTVPDTYAFPVSDTQAYKMLGNGWTVDVIAHIMSHFEGLTEEPVEVLSMYDGMSCGHIALDKLGVQPWLLRYYATEIDKYAIQTTQHNFPETIQLGDAFQVRNDDWRVKE